ncbi:hypothetical protein AFM11_33485 [Mycolicibacterium wolinskyi]|uniref:Uncharacterized protein n=1 Tax=Mycolicibacterium wolinskyi TaxID=59750 RepID=A0A132PC71_9MYCO|nr:hypothetical protein AFM11_33485 [Mycolicibacterium wolinskyi]
MDRPVQSASDVGITCEKAEFTNTSRVVRQPIVLHFTGFAEVVVALVSMSESYCDPVVFAFAILFRRFKFVSTKIDV